MASIQGEGGSLQSEKIYLNFQLLHFSFVSFHEKQKNVNLFVGVDFGVGCVAS